MIYEWQQLDLRGYRAYFSPTSIIEDDKMKYLLELRFFDELVWIGNVDEFDFKFIIDKCNEYGN